MTNEPKKEKRTRKPRRNWEKEMRELATQCRITADLYGEFAVHADASPNSKIAFAARQDALLAVLVKIEGAK